MNRIFGFTTVVRITVGFLLLYISSYAFDLLNEPSDLAVLGGFAVLFAEALFVSWWAKKNFLKTPDSGNKENDKMKSGKILTILLLAGIMGSTTACYTVVEPGHAGVKVNLSGGERGVADLPVLTGRVWYNPVNTRVFEYPTFVQTAVWTKSVDEGSKMNEEISFNSKEGITFTADISLSWQIKRESVPAFYVKFRNDDVSAFTHGFLRNIARDAFTEIGPNYTTEEIYSTRMGELVDNVRARTDSLVKPYGVNLEQFGFIGAPRPPDNIVNALNSKTQAIQDASAAENKLRQITAEANQAVAKAQGEAKSNQALASSVTSQLLEWRRLTIQEKMTAKWDGKLPTLMGGTVPMIQLPTPNK